MSTTIETAAEHPAKRVKADVPRIGTHNGHFHADEALAVYLLRQLPEYASAALTRSRDPATLEACDIIVDVTGVYDGTKHFDHHQRTFAETFSPEHATRLSSAGLVYKHFAPAIIAARIGSDVSTEDARVQLLYRKLYEEFVEALDANDNGISAYPADVKPAFNAFGVSLPAQVGALNPWWNRPVDQAGEDALFEKASTLMGENFMRKLEFYALSWLPARDVVEAAMQKRLEYDPEGRIVVLAQGVPWKEHLYTMEDEMGLEEEKKVVYVLYPEGNGKPNWRVQCVPASKESFESRKPLPEKWRGVRDDELAELTGIPGTVFVHASGFIGGNKSFEGAFEMAKQGLSL